MERQTLWELQQKTQHEEYSGNEDTWAKVEDIWLQVRPLRGREVETIRQQIPQASHKVRCHYRPAITAGMRFVRGSREMHIEQVLNDGERNQWCVIIATEVLGV